MSYTEFKTSDLRPLGKLVLSVFSLLRLVQVETGVGEDKKFTRVNNFTIINFVIKMLGPLHERTLTTIMLLIQVSCKDYPQLHMNNNALLSDKCLEGFTEKRAYITMGVSGLKIQICLNSLYSGIQTG